MKTYNQLGKSQKVIVDELTKQNDTLPVEAAIEEVLRLTESKDLDKEGSYIL